MDILITLPLHLCKEILSGYKPILIRSVYPKKFDCERDLVYVVAKGTNNIMLSFTIKRFIRYWEIDTVTHIVPHLDAKKHFNIKSNPQSFIYVK